MSEVETKQKTVVELLAPDGLGFGEGGISVKDQIKRGILTAEVPGHVHNLLTGDAQAFRDVEVSDDGCGDGRPWGQIIQALGNKITYFNKSKLRAKVFGGGLVVAASMWRTIQGQPAGSETVGQDRAFMAEQLRAHNFEHGAHSDDHAAAGKCGCGAIDNYPLITYNAVKYRPQIMATLEVIYGDDYSDNRAAVEQAFGVYQALADQAGYFGDAGGQESMEMILRSGAVIKELYGGHVEETVVINDVPGTTLDQQYFTRQVKSASVDKPQTVQAFSVDTWRGRDIADLVAKIAHQQDATIDIEATRRLAYADFLVRTLAVAATLTAGDLPVYRRRLQD